MAGLGVSLGEFAARLAAPVLDYALPPRCAGCGVIVASVDSFCAPCWQSIDFLPGPLCDCCGEPLGDHAMAGSRCGACLARAPDYASARAATAFGPVPRLVAHRLKYGRRTGHARLMARHMARWLPEDAAGSLLVPVPLHRWRLWSRGFNQSVLLARALGKMTGAQVVPDALRRTVNTPPLHELGRKSRAEVLKGAFALAPGASALLKDRHVILVDDIWTTGATARACARLVARAGARRIDILCWTRVTRDQAGEARD